MDEEPTIKIQTKYNQTITNLEENNQFTKQEAKELRIYNALTPRVFGHINLHKDKNL